MFLQKRKKYNNILTFKTCPCNLLSFPYWEAFIPCLGNNCFLPRKPLFPREAENKPIVTAEQKH